MKRTLFYFSVVCFFMICKFSSKAQEKNKDKSSTADSFTLGADTLKLNKIRGDADLYLKYSYTETKQLGIQFLTLVSAVLVFSLSFAEKVFSFSSSSKEKKRIMIFAWSFFLLAIVACGLGLVFNALAGGGQVVFLHPQFSLESVNLNERLLFIHRFTFLAYLSLIGAGISFIIGLFCLILAAIKTQHTPQKKYY